MLVIYRLLLNVLFLSLPVFVCVFVSLSARLTRSVPSKMYAQDLLVVVVVMTYACVAPVVIIPALMFFFLAQVVYRHQLL